MAEQYEELISFLHDRNPAVRTIALQTLLEQTPKGSPHRNVFFSQLSGGGLKASRESELYKDLKHLCRDQADIAHNAFRALVNLSDSALVIPSLSDPVFLTFLVSYAIYPQSIMAELACMLLSNITANATSCNALIDLKVVVIQSPSLPGGFYPPSSKAATAAPPLDLAEDAVTKEVQALPLMLDAFVQAAAENSKSERKAKLHFLSSVFANVTATAKGRMYFLTPQPSRPLDSTPTVSAEYPVSKLVLFTEHPDIIRRGGVASTIKNCCFHLQAHHALLSPDTENVAIPPSTAAAPGINILPAILLPLAGPEEFDLEDVERMPPALQFLPDTKKREVDPVLRHIHLESLVLLCTSRWGRDQLRGNGVYRIVQKLHESESDEKVQEIVERLVNLLKRDEEAKIEAAGDLDGGAVNEPEATAEDDEDDMIVEV